MRCQPRRFSARIGLRSRRWLRFTDLVDSWIGLGGTLAAALLAFMFGRVNFARASEHELAEALRQERIHTFATFCAAIIEYRRAQLHRWFTGRDWSDDGRSVEEQRPEVADDV